MDRYTYLYEEIPRDFYFVIPGTDRLLAHSLIRSIKQKDGYGEDHFASANSCHHFPRNVSQRNEGNETR